MKKQLILAVAVLGISLFCFEGYIMSLNSAVTIKVNIEKATFHYPEPVIIQAYLYGPNPIAAARVFSTVTSPSGKKFTIPFSEDILVGNMVPRSGGYVGVLTELEEDGEYHFLIQADDNNRKAHFATGFIQDLPKPMPTDKPSLTFTDPFRVDYDTVIHVSGYSGGKGLPPLKISTLYADVDPEQCVHFSWMVPLNIGSKGQYEIRYSFKEISSEKAWKEAKTIYAGKYQSKGGETQKQKICGLAKGTIHFAVKSSNRKGLQSEISNNYIVVIK